MQHVFYPVRALHPLLCPLSPPSPQGSQRLRGQTIPLIRQAFSLVSNSSTLFSSSRLSSFPADNYPQPITDQAAAQGGTTSGSEIDIETVERAPALSDSDVSTGALLHLPVHPLASLWDERGDGAVDGPASSGGGGGEAQPYDGKAEHADGEHWDADQAGDGKQLCPLYAWQKLCC